MGQSLVIGFLSVFPFRPALRGRDEIAPVCGEKAQYSLRNYFKCVLLLQHAVPAYQSAARAWKVVKGLTSYRLTDGRPGSCL